MEIKLETAQDHFGKAIELKLNGEWRRCILNKVTLTDGVVTFINKKGDESAEARTIDRKELLASELMGKYVTGDKVTVRVNVVDEENDAFSFNGVWMGVQSAISSGLTYSDKYKGKQKELYAPLDKKHINRAKRGKK